MNIQILPYSSTPCELKVFTINGLSAVMTWFGKLQIVCDEVDCNECSYVKYECCHKQFVPYSVPNVRQRLPEAVHLTDDEIREIQDVLMDTLDIYSCNMCIDCLE